jgi:hypothetical protein
MEHEDRAGPHIPQNMPGRECDRGDRGIVRVDRSQCAAVFLPRHGGDHGLGVPARARPGPAHRAESDEQPVRLLEVPRELPGAESNARAILHEVVADLVALGHELVHQSFPAPHPLGDQEERCARAVTPQLGQDQRRRGGIGAVVHGEGDERRLQRHPVQAAGGTRCQPIENPGRRAGE